MHTKERITLTTLFGFACFSAALVVLGGCATRTPVSGTFPPITPHAAQSGQYNGTVVRWGGILLKTIPKDKQTCFRVLGLPLADNGRPQRDTGTRETGRFLACAAGFYDPALYTARKEITFIGTIQGVRTEAVGDYKYPYPVLEASTVYLWPRVERTRTAPYYYPGYYGGFWGPWWGGPGWWGGVWGYGYWPPYYGHRHPPHHRPPTPPPPSMGAPRPPLHRPIVSPRPPLRVKQAQPPAQPEHSQPPPAAIPKIDRPHRKTEPPL